MGHGGASSRPTCIARAMARAPQAQAHSACSPGGPAHACRRMQLNAACAACAHLCGSGQPAPLDPSRRETVAAAAVASFPAGTSLSCNLRAYLRACVHACDCGHVARCGGQQVDSEQTNSALGLGVALDRDCSVKAAGGWLVQILPFCSEVGGWCSGGS